MIRKARISDAEEIAYVINESNYRAYQGIIPKEYFRYPVVTSDDIVRDMGKMLFYVYEVNGKIIGVAALHPKLNEGLGIIRWVYVHPDHQRRGIGTALVKHLEEVTLRLNLRKLRLITHEGAYWAIDSTGN